MTVTAGDFDIQLEWGMRGVEQLTPVSDVVIIVDVLSFTTSVEIAVSRGAVVYPFAGDHIEAEAYARELHAELAAKSRENGYSLSPQSLREIPAGTRLVLPSPNGSTLSLGTGKTRTLAGSLRNAGAIANRAMDVGHRIAVIAAGERWPDGSLRPSFEDHIGAGAIIEGLRGTRSPEAESALAAWKGAKTDLKALLLGCASGRELVDRGFEPDVLLASEWNVSACAPELQARAFRSRTG